MPHTDLPLAELRAFRPEIAEPAGFDAFWARTLAESRALAVEPVLDAVGGPATMRRKQLVRVAPGSAPDGVATLDTFGPLLVATDDGVYPVCWLTDAEDNKIGLAVFFRERDAPPGSEGAVS